MKKQTIKKKTITSEEPDWRSIYIENRNNSILDFEDDLKEIQKDEPSVGGIINGMNYIDFAYKRIFFFLKEQEEYITQESDYTDSAEELKIFNKCFKKAEKILGKNFKVDYENYKKNN